MLIAIGKSKKLYWSLDARGEYYEPIMIKPSE